MKQGSIAEFSVTKMAKRQKDKFKFVFAGQGTEKWNLLQIILFYKKGNWRAREMAHWVKVFATQACQLEFKL